MVKFMPNLRYTFIIVALVILVSCIAGCIDPGPEPIKGNITTVKEGTEILLTYDELVSMPSVTGHGYSVSTVGIKNGPHICTGIPLEDVIALVGGMKENDLVWVSAPDGYMWVFDYEQLNGENFITFDENLKEIPSPPLTVILMYEQDGQPLTYDEGAPFRIAIVSESEGVITEGSSWVKWIDRVEVKPGKKNETV
jgi:DMSO/TMAO reductase YedYZ molybdopterin-dependent catalytic subunit